MQSEGSLAPQTLGRWIGCAILATLVVGITSALFIVTGIDINMSADVEATARNMLEAEERLRAKGYIAALTFAMDGFVSIGLFLLLRRTGQLMAAWCLLVSLAAGIVTLLGAVFALNAAQFAGNSAYQNITDETQRLMLSALQATSSYTSFHLGLVLSSFAMAGFFYLFLKSALIPKLIAGWGLFASLFVAITIVARDFIPILGHGNITAAFMVSNLIAIVTTGLYLAVRSVRISSDGKTA